MAGVGNGHINPQPEWKITRETASCATIDCDTGLGTILAQKAMDIVDGRIRLVGNINNPETLFAKGPEEVREEVRQNLDAGVQLIAPECAIPLQTSLENLKAIPEAVREWHKER